MANTLAPTCAIFGAILSADADHGHNSWTRRGLNLCRRKKILAAKGFVGCVGTVLIGVADLGLVEANPTSAYIRALQVRFSGTWTVSFVFAIWTVGLAIAPSLLIKTALKKKKVLHTPTVVTLRKVFFIDCQLPTYPFSGQLKHMYLGQILS